MKKYLLILMLLPACGLTDYLEYEEGNDHEYVGPTVEEIELLGVSETSPSGSAQPLSARVRNNADAYLDRLAIQCTVTDQRGFRVFKDIVFRSGPLFSIRIAWPPISTPELGIPPGAVTEVGLYTKDNRWTRGHGDYRYDCRVHGVSGRE